MNPTLETYLPRLRTPPYQHQAVGIGLLLENPNFGLLDEMGVGKSKQVVDAACALNEEDLIHAVLVITPAAVRGVWVNPTIGEIRKHAWVASHVYEFHSFGVRTVWKDDNAKLHWIVTNYEFIRTAKNRDRLIGMLGGHKVMMVLDESSFIKNRQAVQTKACFELGKLAVRRVILNGTPIANNPLDLWSQLRFLNPRILPFHNFYHFRANYAVLGGWHNKQVLKWKNLEDLQNRVAPHVIRREKKDCLDLPEKIYTQLEVPLSDANWQTYRQMRDQAVVWLDENPTMASQAGVRVMRLSQITSGLLGGFEAEDALVPNPAPKRIGSEKFDALQEWLTVQAETNPGLKVIVWCRFRAEIERLADELQGVRTYKLYGGQSRADRAEAIARFSTLGMEFSMPDVLVAQPQAGGFGLNLIAANTVIYISSDFNLMTRLQSEDRVHRPGQTKRVVYLDMLATGPKGQRTVDHEIVAALRRKDDLARWTCAAWKKVLMAEADD